MPKGPISWKGDRAEIIERAAATRRAPLDRIARLAHPDYMGGLSLKSTARKHGTDGGTLRKAFIRLGLFVRPFKPLARQANGSPVRYVPFSSEQLNDLVNQSETFRVPTALKFEWRSWDLARRGAFVAKLRAKFKQAADRPDLPFSANVEAFDYASPRAHAIAKKVNAGLDSRQRHTTIKIICQGVIYQEQLWFWSAKAGYCLGSWLPEDGRPMLHHHIWAEHHGRPVPPHSVIRAIDGNPNNLQP